MRDDPPFNVKILNPVDFVGSITGHPMLPRRATMKGPESTVYPEKRMKLLTHLFEDLAAKMRRTAAAAGIDAVHDLRVSVRRATAGLRIYQSQLPEARRLSKEIKAIRDWAAAVRDRDVTCQLLRRHRLPTSDPAYCYLQGQRDLAASHLQKFLAAQLRQDRPRRWQRWIEHSR